MINVSNDFKKRMEENRGFKSYAEITFPGGAEITLDSSQFTTGNNSLTDGAGVSSFPLGIAIQKNVQFNILNDAEQYKDYDFVGAKIRLYIDFTERIEKGTYTVVTPETYGETVSITAYDDMYKADKEYTTKLTFPQTAGTVLRDICSTCDIRLGSTSFLHDDFIIQNKPTGTFREVIGQIAMIACGNARIDTRNYLQIMSYDFGGWKTSGEYHLLNEFTAPKIEYNDTIITGFKAIINGETSEEDLEILAGDDTYVITVENPLIAGHEQTVLSWLQDRICDVPFRPFSGDAISNPLIEFMDLAKVQDRRGKQYNTFVTDVTFAMPGYTALKNSTPSMSRSALEYSNPAQKVEQRVRALVEKEKTDREQALENIATRLANSSGLYITPDPQLDGSTIYYMHNKPTLAESDIVWKLTAEAFGISTDGGKTYPYGFTVTGEMITRLLYAEGINADYIDSGAITIKDPDGNIIFSADMDSKKVIISGESVKIGSKTASAMFDELSGKVSIKAESDQGTLETIIANDGTWESKFTDANGRVLSGIEFDFVHKQFVFNGSGSFTGELNIGEGNFIVDVNGNVTAHGDTKIYGGKYYAMDDTGSGGYTEMDVGGFGVYSNDAVQRVKVGFPTSHPESPYIILNGGTAENAANVIMKQFSDGMWIGNSEPMNTYGKFIARSGYNGIFISLTDSKTYVVFGTDMQSIYTGEAIARFG